MKLQKFHFASSLPLLLVFTFVQSQLTSSNYNGPAPYASGSTITGPSHNPGSLPPPTPPQSGPVQLQVQSWPQITNAQQDHFQQSASRISTSRKEYPISRHASPYSGSPRSTHGRDLRPLDSYYYRNANSQQLSNREQPSPRVPASIEISPPVLIPPPTSGFIEKVNVDDFTEIFDAPIGPKPLHQLLESPSKRKSDAEQIKEYIAHETFRNSPSPVPLSQESAEVDGNRFLKPPSQPPPSSSQSEHFKENNPHTIINDQPHNYHSYSPVVQPIPTQPVIYFPLIDDQVSSMAPPSFPKDFRSEPAHPLPDAAPSGSSYYSHRERRMHYRSPSRYSKSRYSSRSKFKDAPHRKSHSRYHKDSYQSKHSHYGGYDDRHHEDRHHEDRHEDGVFEDRYHDNNHHGDNHNYDHNNFDDFDQSSKTWKDSKSRMRDGFEGFDDDFDGFRKGFRNSYDDKHDGDDRHARKSKTAGYRIRDDQPAEQVLPSTHDEPYEHNGHDQMMPQQYDKAKYEQYKPKYYHHDSKKKYHKAIEAAVDTKHSIETYHKKSKKAQKYHPTVDINSGPLPLTLRFNSYSSNIRAIQSHKSPEGKVQKAVTVDEPDLLIQTVKKPVIQSIREVIQPVRQWTQEVRPAYEHIQTVIAQGDKKKMSKHHKSKYDYKESYGYMNDEPRPSTESTKWLTTANYNSQWNSAHSHGVSGALKNDHLPSLLAQSDHSNLSNLTDNNL